MQLCWFSRVFAARTYEARQNKTNCGGGTNGDGRAFADE
jgi:hypothetical protein